MNCSHSAQAFPDRNAPIVFAVHGEVPFGDNLEQTLQDDKVRIEANIDAARRAGAAISSRLLQVGGVIRDKPEKDAG